jgi:hypothetical protein
MPQFIKVATTAELAHEQAKLVEVEGQKIALFRVDGGFYALSDTCTHRRGPLSEGTIEGSSRDWTWRPGDRDAVSAALNWSTAEGSHRMARRVSFGNIALS